MIVEPRWLPFDSSGWANFALRQAQGERILWLSLSKHGAAARQFLRQPPMAAKPLLAITATLVLFLAACAQTPAQVNNSANDLFEKAQTEETPGAALGAYEESLDAYEEAQESEPEKGEPYYNAGNALYRMEDYEGALAEYDEALKYAEDDLRAQGLFNKGNVYFDTEAYPDAIEAYKEVLRIQPENEDAKHNLELAMSMLPQEEEQEQGEEPDENQEGPQEQEQQQDQQQDQQDEQNEQDQQEQENEEQQDEQQDQQQNNEQDDQQQEQQQQQQPTQTEPITPEQARQLLETFESQTLQERLQQILVSPEPPTNPW